MSTQWSVEEAASRLAYALDDDNVHLVECYGEEVAKYARELALEEACNCFEETVSLIGDPGESLRIFIAWMRDRLNALE
jgi:hypothetical protein